MERWGKSALSAARAVRWQAEKLAGVGYPRRPGDGGGLVPPLWTSWLLMERCGLSRHLIADLAQLPEPHVAFRIRLAIMMMTWPPYAAHIERLTAKIPYFLKVKQGLMIKGGHMRRSGRLGWKVDWARVRARAADAPGMAIAGLFIGLSGLMSVTFGYNYGGLFFAGAALAIEGFADLAVPLMWHRLRFFGRTALIAIFVICIGYKLEAAKKFAAEHLGKYSAATATRLGQSYDAAKQTVEGLRKTIADNADARASDLINAEIEGLLRDPKTEGCPAGAVWNGPVTSKICPQVDKLRVELARAKARDRAPDRDSRRRWAPLPRLRPRAAASRKPPVRWRSCSRLLGIHVGGLGADDGEPVHGRDRGRRHRRSDAGRGGRAA